MTFILRRLRGQKARSSGTPLAFQVPMYQAGQPVYNEQSFENAVRFGLRLNELVYAAITARANTGAFVALHVYDRRSHLKLPDHPLRRLLEKPNPYMTETDFWSMTVTYQMLSGRAYWEKQRTRRGDVIALWPLRPDYVLPLRSDGVTFLPGYQFKAPGAEPMTIAPTELMDFTLYDPLDIYRALAPVQVAARTIDIDNSATDFIKTMWERGAVPMGILKSKNKLQDGDIGEIRKRWAERYTGYDKWGQPAVLDRDSEFQKIAFSLAEIQAPELDARSETRICAALGVPPIVIGTAFGLSRATLANYEVSVRAWWENVLVPQYKRFSDQVNHDLVPEYGDNVYVKFDFTEVAALQEDANKRWERASNGFTGGWVTLNDARRETGLDIVDGGDVFMQTMGTVLRPAAEFAQRDARPGSPGVDSDTGNTDPELPTPEPAEVEDAATDTAEPPTTPATDPESTKAARPTVPDLTADDIRAAREFLRGLGYDLPDDNPDDVA